jgi:hypothetical protein
MSENSERRQIDDPVAHDIVMPPAFPSTEFRAFLQAASQFFPAPLSDKVLDDPQEKRKRSGTLIGRGTRYATATAVAPSVKANSGRCSPMRVKHGGPDGVNEEFTYKLERCIYLFFMGALSVSDSFAFCRYFLGHAIQPGAFPQRGQKRQAAAPFTAPGTFAAASRKAEILLKNPVTDPIRAAVVFMSLVNPRSVFTAFVISHEFSAAFAACAKIATRCSMSC